MTVKDELDPPWSVRSDLYIGVGQTISIWAAMEGRIIEIAATLLGSTIEKTGVVFYSIMNFHAWLNIIDDLFSVDEKLKEHRDEWTKISADLRSMNDTRVRLAHHTTWGGDEKPGETFGLKPHRFDARTKSKKYAALTTTEISKFSDDIEKIRERLEGLLTKIGGRSPLTAAIARLLASRGKSVQPTDGPPVADAQSHQNPKAPGDPPQSSEAG